MTTSLAPRTIHVAHSPDSDDAFMFYALAEGKVDTEGLRYVHELQDIETLNQRARRGELEVTAGLDPRLRLPRRQLRAAAARRVDGRPVRAAPRRADADDAGGREGEARRRARPAHERLPRAAAVRARLRAVWTPFDQIEDAVLAGDVDIGLLIHEGQLTYGDRGLHLVADMGEWWHGETGLPLRWAATSCAAISGAS
jgi:1,4-dihydroxy-6-naphthoate synthase